MVRTCSLQPQEAQEVTCLLIKFRVLRWELALMKPFFIELLRQDWTKSTKKSQKRDLVIKCDHLNKTLPRREEGGQAQTHKLPLPEWTPPAAAHTVSHISLLCRCGCVCEPSSPQLTANILFYFYGHINTSVQKKSRGPVASQGSPTFSFLPLLDTDVEKMSNTLCVVGSVFGKLCTCLWLAAPNAMTHRTDPVPSPCFRIRRGTAR